LAEVPCVGQTFAPCDKAMQTVNDHDKDVHNGNIGIIEDVDLKETEVAVEFEGRTDTFALGGLETLVATDAAPIH
jgi:exodeoxyribonuclease V alpha subunit